MKTLGVIFGALGLVLGGTALIHYQEPLKEALLNTETEESLSYTSPFDSGEPRTLID